MCWKGLKRNCYHLQWIKFVHSVCTSAQGFLEAAPLHLHSTFSKWDGNVFPKRQFFFATRITLHYYIQIELFSVTFLVLGHHTKFVQPLIVKHEMPQGSTLRFFHDKGMFCRRKQASWSYKPKVNKSLLLFLSGPSKLVKQAVSKINLNKAPCHSCPRKCRSSFLAQPGVEAGFSFLEQLWEQE